MATILSIESSGTICSLALHQNGALLALVESDEPNIHGQSLALFIKELLEIQKMDINTLDAIAVSEGPGSYTGLRIGASIAKGICYATGLPLIAVDTLQALAYAAQNQNQTLLKANSLLIPMVDARRMEVYLAGFDMNLKKTIPTKPVILDEHFYKTLSKTTYVFGNGANKIDFKLVTDSTLFLKDIELSSKNLGGIAYKKFLNQEFENISTFQPVYLKEFANIIS